MDIDVHGVGAFAEVVAGLIDADGKPPGNGSDDIAVGAQEKRLRNFRIADAADQSAAARAVERQNPEQVLEAARDAVGVVVFLGVGVAELARRDDDNVFAGLHVDSGIGPGLVAGNLNFLGDAALAGGRLLPRFGRLRRRGSALTIELCAKGRGGGGQERHNSTARQ